MEQRILIGPKYSNVRTPRRAACRQVSDMTSTRCRVTQQLTRKSIQTVLHFTTAVPDAPDPASYSAAAAAADVTAARSSCYGNLTALALQRPAEIV